MRKFTFTGQTVFIDLATGFWGFVDENNRQWRPVEPLPQELQKENVKVKVTARKAKEQLSLFMWGTAIEIIDYEIIK